MIPIQLINEAYSRNLIPGSLAENGNPQFYRWKIGPISQWGCDGSGKLLWDNSVYGGAWLIGPRDSLNAKAIESIEDIRIKKIDDILS